jgi:predicted DsbA family dithiol-disulfide isomerase
MGGLCGVNAPGASLLAEGERPLRAALASPLLGKEHVHSRLICGIFHVWSLALSEPEEDPGPLPIDVVGDVTCPWCFLGKRLVDAVVGSVPGLAVELRWYPYQIDPGLPPDGMDYRAYLAEKFGAEEVEPALAKIVDAGREFGLELAVDKIVRLPNTFQAHRLIRHSYIYGVQPQVVERLFQAHFLYGQDIGDPKILVEIARKSRMDPDATGAYLAGMEDAASLRQEMDDIRKSGVDVVPRFTFGGKVEIIGLETADVFADALFNAIPEG